MNRQNQFKKKRETKMISVTCETIYILLGSSVNREREREITCKRNIVTLNITNFCIYPFSTSEMKNNINRDAKKKKKNCAQPYTFSVSKNGISTWL